MTEVVDKPNNEDLNYNAKKKPSRIIYKVINIALIAIIVLLACFLVVKIFFVTTIKVEQTSMYPTYEDGETVIVNRLGSVERGKVVVFFDDDVAIPRLASAFPFLAGDANLLIKRVIAVSNDKVWLQYTADGYIIKIQSADGGDIISESYLNREGENVDLAKLTLNPDTVGVLRNATQSDPYVVGENSVFAVGDNRTVSIDSRRYGDVKLSRIIGTV